MNERKRKASLRGWWKLLPFILLPSLAVFFEAWVHTQILKDHYEASALLKELHSVRDASDLLRDRHHHLERMERIHYQAIDLGLIEPSPGQIEVIFADAIEEEFDDGDGFPDMQPESHAD